MATSTVRAAAARTASGAARCAGTATHLLGTTSLLCIGITLHAAVSFLAPWRPRRATARSQPAWRQWPQNPIQYVLEDWPAGLPEPGPTPSTVGPMESKTMALVEKGVCRRLPKKNANTALKASCAASSNYDLDSGNTCKASQ